MVTGISLRQFWNRQTKGEKIPLNSVPEANRHTLTFTAFLYEYHSKIYKANSRQYYPVAALLRSSGKLSEIMSSLWKLSNYCQKLTSSYSREMMSDMEISRF